METYPVLENAGIKDGYENIVRFLDEDGVLTQEEIINKVCNLKRRTVGGSPITVLKALDVTPVSLSDEEMKRYCRQKPY